MKLIILAITITCFISCTNIDAGNDVSSRNIDTVSRVEDKPAYNGISHSSWFGKYDTYSGNSSRLSGTLGKDTVFLSGAWYISSRDQSHVNIKIGNPQETKIFLGKKIFLEHIPEIGSTRITNYKGVVTILDRNKVIKLKANQTLLISKKGRYNKFYNESAGADSTWLTSTSMEFDNLNLPTLIYRLTDRYGCTVKYNGLTPDALKVDNFTGGINFNQSLYKGLSALQMMYMSDDEKFSFSIKDKVVYIDSRKR